MNIEKLKQKILDLAIRGKLVPQDPNDEPASVLIEKIREEKEKSIKEGKIKASKEDSYIYKGSDNCYYEKIGNTIKKIDKEKLFNIPESWAWTRLGTIFSIGSSKRVHKSDWTNSGVPFYRARDIEPLNDGVFKSALYINDDFYNSIKEQYGVPKINDILVSAVGTLGKTYIVENSNPFYYKDGNIICFSNLYNINPYFIKLLFTTDFIDKQIHDNSKGTTVDTYTIIHANQTFIPLPPRKEQDRIVSVYTKFLSKLKEVNKEYTSILNYVDLAKNKILDSVFGENSSYKSYYQYRTKTTLANIVPKDKIGDGDWVLSENMDENGEYSLVQLKHIGNGEYIDKPYNHINNNFFISNNCTEIKSNYLLINRLVANNMNVCLLPKLDFKCITSVDVCWIAPSDNYNQKYLMYYLLSPEFQNQVLMKCSGSTRKRISKSNLIRIEMNIHEYKYQELIVNEIEKMFNILDSIIS